MTVNRMLIVSLRCVRNGQTHSGGGEPSYMIKVVM